MMAKSEYKKQKDKTWEAFSEYIRYRDALEYQKTYPESVEEAKCITCDRVLPIKNLQAGHFIPGRTNVVLFDDTIVFAQCYSCNVGRNGNLIEYTLRMVDRNGREWVDNKLASSTSVLKYGLCELRELESEFRRKTEEIKKEMSYY